MPATDARVDTMNVPGAVTSGFNLPPIPGPLLLDQCKCAELSACAPIPSAAGLVFSEFATARIFFAPPGETILLRFGPEFPAAATTNILLLSRVKLSALMSVARY